MEYDELEHLLLQVSRVSIKYDNMCEREKRGGKLTGASKIDLSNFLRFDLFSSATPTL